MKKKFKIRIPEIKLPNFDTLEYEFTKFWAYAGIVTTPMLLISLYAIWGIDKRISELGLESLIYGDEREFME